MGHLPDAALLDLWDRGAGEHALDRALSLLALAEPGVSRAELAALPLAERDRRLFGLAADWFGPEVVLVATCGDCGAETELRLGLAGVAALPAPEAEGLSFLHQGAEVRYRLPDSRDLARALQAGDAAAGRRVLLAGLLAVAEPDDALLAALDAVLAERAGLEVLTLGYACTGCGVVQAEAFDILDDLWRRVAARAKRALWDVHMLARAYGWTSGEILALSPARRAAHLALVGS